jgi:hypothetical protein
MKALRENGSKRFVPMVLTVLLLVISSMACRASGPETSLENLRLSYDKNGEEVTSLFSNTDDFYAVVELNDATLDTVVTAVWTAVDVADTDPEDKVRENTLNVTQESFSGTIYFRLSNDEIWPSGRYRVDIYLNDTLDQSLEFNVE